MQCPYCKTDNDRVVDSRSSGGGMLIRRRRECLACTNRFTTYERVEKTPLRVVKKDGSRTEFDRGRILQGVRRACHKRPVSEEIIERVVADIEASIERNFDREVPSSYIGEQVMKHLREVDQVAYVRFASVYREFKDAADFAREIEDIATKT